MNDILCMLKILTFAAASERFLKLCFIQKSLWFMNMKKAHIKIKSY